LAESTTWTTLGGETWTHPDNWTNGIANDNTLDVVINIGSAQPQRWYGHYKTLSISSYNSDGTNRAAALSLTLGTGGTLTADLSVGMDGPGILTQTGGSMVLGNNVWGDPTGSDAWYSMWLGECLINSNGDGTYNISGGTLTVLWSAVPGQGTVNIGYLGTGHMTVSGTADINIDNMTLGGVNADGYRGHGTLTINGSNASIDLATFDMIYGDDETLRYEFDATGVTPINCTGTARLNGVLDLTNLGGLAAGTYTVLSAAGGIIDNGLTLASGIIDWSFAIVGKKRGGSEKGSGV
jgi:hypothetical protein